MLTPLPETLSDKFTRREFALVHASQSNFAKLKGVSAQQHLREGFERRVLLNQTSRLHIEGVANPEQTEVLNTYACSELNVHLNSFYVQLRGALDNLAWVLHYHHGLLGPHDESHRGTQRDCGLFNKAFLRPLDSVEPALANFLRSKQSWFDAFKELRDPVAHRVPLYAMPCVIREGSPDAERLAELRQRMNVAVEARDLNRVRDTFFEAQGVGSYEPWFTQYGPKGYAVRDIRRQIDNDHGEFLEIAQAVFAFLFAES